MSRGPDDGVSGRTESSKSKRFDEFPMQDHRNEGADYVGLAGTGGPWFYNPENNVFFEGEYNEKEGHIAATGEEREHHPEDTVGEAIEKLGDELGWDSLSEWANDHLEHDDNEE